MAAGKRGGGRWEQHGAPLRVAVVDVFKKQLGAAQAVPFACLHKKRPVGIYFDGVALYYVIAPPTCIWV